MNTSELIDHVTSTAMAHNALIANARKVDAISLLGHGSCTPMSRAARLGRDPRFDARDAFEGVRPARGLPFAAAHNAKSGARKAASAKAATGPGRTVGSTRYRSRRS